MIYHYTTFKGLKCILSSKKIWLTYSQELNDVTDRSYTYMSVIVNLFKSDNENAKILLSFLDKQDILDVIKKLFDVSFYSASFCNRNDNNYLWVNYAEDSSGFCIKIDEEYMKDGITKILRDNYNSLGSEDVYENEYNLNPREVKYELNEADLIKALSITKALSGFDFASSDKDKKAKSKFWLKLILMVFAGTIKHANYHDEEETRILFQNFYDKQYINKNSFYLLQIERYKYAYEKLGLTKEIKVGKRRFELNLESFFDSKLIPEIIIGRNYNHDLKEVIDLLNSSGLSDTKITRME